MYIDKPNKNEVIDNLNHSGYEKGLYTIYENTETVTIQYVLTNKCNLECTYCPKKFLYDESNFENIDKFIEDLDIFYNNNKKDIEIYLTGGEVLTDTKALEYILKKISRIDYIVNTIIFSNGVALTSKIIKRLNLLHSLFRKNPFRFYLTIHPSSVSLQKVSYLNNIIKYSKFFISKIIILNNDYLDTYLNNLKLYDGYLIQPNMIDTIELEKLRLNQNLPKSVNQKLFRYNNEPIDIIDLFYQTKFNFKGWECSAGKTYFIYNKEKLYTCSSAYHKKQEIGEKLSEYKIKSYICEHDCCVCEQSLHKKPKS